MSGKDYEMVAGLETHVELKTATKIFCGCSTAFRRGAEHPVLPGVYRYAGVAAGIKPPSGSLCDQSGAGR